MRALAAGVAAWLLVGAPVVRADEIISTEGFPSADDTQEPAHAGPSRDRSGAPVQPPLVEESADSAAEEPSEAVSKHGLGVSERRGPAARLWHISGGVSGSSHGRFGAHLGIARAMGRFWRTEFTGAYERRETDADAGETYGPDLALALRLVNPLLVTPFVKAGVGYEKWRRERDGEVFDDAGSMTAIGTWGLDLALTRNFGLTLARCETLFLQTPPKTYADPLVEEPKIRIANAIGFRVLF